EIILYQPNETVSLEVRLDEDTVWLSQAQMAELFQTTKQNVSLHINNIFKENELDKNSVVKDYLTTALDRKAYKTKYYCLDVIISVGYRVKSIRGTHFRQWANKILKDFLLHNHSILQEITLLRKEVDTRFIKHEEKLQEHQNKIDFFVRTSLPPVEGLMHEGQIFDARVCVENLIKQAKREVIMIDGYVDAATFEILDVRQKGVSATIYTERIGESLLRIKELHDSQYPDKTIELKKYAENFHDRFLIIDDVVYHFGASFKDLGNRLFAFNKMGLDKNLILSAVKGEFEKP
ncbi:MAG: virulence RhuM family protein, partial [Bacteroidales bacterium]|nr:virulence RhuM family protein [Bacteroidales bacterium]